MTKKITFLFLLFSVGVILAAYGFDLPKWFPFNRQNALEEWQEKIFRDRVFYVVEPGGKTGYLSAKSEQACSGLIYRIKFEATKTPMISWDWKVTRFPDKRAAKEQEGGWLEKDDYAARVYVIFPNWNFMKIKSLEYIWDEDLPEGTVMTSPYSNNIKLLVIHSGTKNLNQWVHEERNIYMDYMQAFGYTRRLRVGAIALMTDADNTASTAEAFYKNIKVGY